MNCAEMLRRLANGENPLKLSIEKWEDIVAGKGKDYGDSNCALCETYGSCRGCPVVAKTGKKKCRATPYTKFSVAVLLDDVEEMWYYAVAELEFLKSLPPSEKEALKK